jgi:hypothetical protein
MEADFDRLARCNMDAITFHSAADLFTSFPQPESRKCKIQRSDKLVEKGFATYRNLWRWESTPVTTECMIPCECGSGG